MAFTFNAEDIQLAGKTLQYGGDYLVKVQRAEYKDTNKRGQEMFTVWFEVMDGSEQGATIVHTFMDDQSATDYTPFRYREINAMLQAIGGVATGTVIELSQVDTWLKDRILAVRVDSFERSVDDKGKIHFNPRVAAFSEPIKASVPNQGIPRPQENAPATPQPQAGGFAPTAPAQQPSFGNGMQDPFAANAVPVDPNMKMPFDMDEPAPAAPQPQAPTNFPGQVPPVPANDPFNGGLK
jgi:hypothetical protein